MKFLSEIETAGALSRSCDWLSGTELYRFVCTLLGVAAALALLVRGILKFAPSLTPTGHTCTHARKHAHTHARTHARAHTHRSPHQRRIQSLCRLGCGWRLARNPRSVGYQERAERGGAPSSCLAWWQCLGLKPHFHSRFTGINGRRDGWHPVGVGRSCGKVSRSFFFFFFSRSAAALELLIHLTGSKHET